MKHLGCAYYPEYWGRERFAEDARLMREAGVNIARIGEFAWCRMEPEEGSFDIDWLHECIETLARQGVNVLMCTPTATPPAWLTSAYPDTLLVRADGRRAEHGSRRHYCVTSDAYRRLGARITDVLSRELFRHANVVAWQLDNEFGPEMSWCHCPNCQARFQAWLKARYGSVAELNRRWGTGFWSMDYTDWREVRLGCVGGEYPSRNLDSKRFWSDMTVEFALAQAEIIRHNHPGAVVTTNGMGPIYGPIDYYRLFDRLDVACDDLYFDIGTMDTDVAAMNVFRSIKPGRAYWITETGAGALDHNRAPEPRQFRAWAWSSLAHGAEAHMVFRWRSCLSGQEQELQGILEHSGAPRRRYAAVKACFTELRRLWDEHRLGALPLPEAPVAIVQSQDVLWGYESSRVGADVDYHGLMYLVHKALWRRHVVTDFVPPGRELSRYRLVVLPSTVIVPPRLAEALAGFVEAGGTLLAIGQIAMRDENDNYLASPAPGGLGSLLGCTIHGGTYLASHVGPDEALWVPAPRRRDIEMPLAGSLDGAPVEGRAARWAADVELAGGEALMAFRGDAYDGQPAVVAKRTGRGGSLYVAAARVDDALTGRIVDHALGLADVARGPETPEWVEVVRRGDVTFVVNHSDAPARVELGGAGRALVGTFEGGAAELGPWGVCAVRA